MAALKLCAFQSLGPGSISSHMATGNRIANKLHDLDGHDGIARVLKAEEAGRRGGQRRNVTMGPSHGMGDKLDPSLLVLKIEKRGHKPRKSEHL